MAITQRSSQSATSRTDGSVAATVLDRPAWQLRGLCNAHPAAVFFPERRQSSESAKTICAECDVADACLTFAMDERIDVGVWGGYSAAERQQLRREGVGVDVAIRRRRDVALS